MLEALRLTSAEHVAMTGSGSASFAVYNTLPTALDVARGLRKIWKVFVVPTLGRDQARVTVRAPAS